MATVDGERIFTWACRSCGIGGFLWLLASEGTDAPTQFYIMLMGFVWGPELVRGKIRSLVGDDEKDGK